MRALTLVTLCAFLVAPAAGQVVGETGAGADGTAESVAVVNGRIFDGTRPAVATDGVALIEGDRIVEVGLADEVDLSGVTTFIDAEGGFVMPGVIDAHVHVFFSGLTPAEVIVAATQNGAAAIGREGELGTLEPGKLADIIIVDGDPLSDLNALENVRVVIYEGKRITP